MIKCKKNLNLCDAGSFLLLRYDVFGGKEQGNWYMLKLTKDFDTVKKKYLDVIAHTPKIRAGRTFVTMRNHLHN